MATRATPKNPRQIYLQEWRRYKRVTQEQLAERLGMAGKGTISRWETDTRGVDRDTMEAYAEALGIEPQDLYRNPFVPSLDALLRGQPEQVVRQAAAIVETLTKTLN